MARAIRVTDAVSVAMFEARASATELAAETWPRTPPESRRPTFLGLLGRLLLSARAGEEAGVVTRDGGVRGLVVARARAGGLVWDVEHLLTDHLEIGQELLSWACERALAARARRVFLDTPDGGRGAEAARRSRFELYSQGVTYRIPPGFPRDPADTLPARPRLRSDDAPLFQLYSTVVPANVRAVEAMTHEEWAALYPGRKLWAPAILGTSQDYVWELGTRIAGWMRVVFGQRSQFLDLLLDPSHEGYADRMVRWALVQMSTKVPVVIDVRDYQGAARAALERAGFEPHKPYSVWVRQLAARVAEPKLAAARAPA